MKAYLFNIDKTLLQATREILPAAKRSKLVRAFLTSGQPLPYHNQTILQEPTSLLLTLDDQSNQRLNDLASASNKSRSEIIREVLVFLLTQHKDAARAKGYTRTFTVPSGTLQALKWIEHGERDIIIEDFLLNVYKGPTKSADKLKSRPKTANETIAVTLSDDAYNYMQEMADQLGQKVKRSHIFKDMMEQFLIHIKNRETDNVDQLQRDLFKTAATLHSHLSAKEICERIANYLGEEEQR